MSDKMIAAAKAFAKGGRAIFPIMKISDLPMFFEQIRIEKAKL